MEEVMKRRRLRARWVIIIALVVLASVALAVQWLRRVDVVVMQVVRGRAVDAIYATGTVEAERRVVVKARVAGPITELSATEGDPVRAAQLLARVENPVAAFDLRRSQVEAAAANAQGGKDAPQLTSLRAK